jgi:hypothetical protein
MPKNPCDDYSFVILEQLMAETIYLSRGIDKARIQMRKNFKIIKSEKKRLTEQGYDMDKLNPMIIKGVER